jgi:hydrogenase 3 maturation protease
MSHGGHADDAPRATDAVHSDHGQDDHVHDWEAALREAGAARRVVIGLGNPDRGDDGAGAAVADGLIARGIPNAFNCAGVPENYLGRIVDADPDEVILIDATEFGAEPGSVALYLPDSAVGGTCSTHAGGLNLLFDYLGQATSARFRLLAIQPVTIEAGKPLSPPVVEAVEAIIASDVWM